MKTLHSSSVSFLFLIISQPHLFLKLCFLQTKLYIEDWIGLKTLDDAGKVKFVGVPGDHLEMAHDDVVKYVVPYLQNQFAFSS